MKYADVHKTVATEDFSLWFQACEVVFTYGCCDDLRANK